MSVAVAPGRRLVSVLYHEWYPFDHMPVFAEQVVSNNAVNLQEGDVLLVWGGEDISPALYNEPVNRFGDGDWQPSHRDAIEWEHMKRAVELNIPIIGVCRGAQMLCALAGGSLWQHVDRHSGDHVVHTHDGQKLITNSLHHQMMRLDAIPKEEYDLIAWTPARSEVYHHGQGLVHVKQRDDIDPEFVYFSKIQGFAVQWHPEFVGYPDEATDYVFNFINSKLEILV